VVTPDDLTRHARHMQERVLLMLVNQREGWADNTHMTALLEDVRENRDVTPRELAFAIEWLKMLPMRDY
jgi:hypothetical protein